MRPLRERLLSSTAAISAPAVAVDRDDTDAPGTAVDGGNPAPATSPDPNALLPPRATARRLNVATQTLARWRMEQRGPPYYLVGGRVAYRWADIEAWLAGRRVAGKGNADAG